MNGKKAGKSQGRQGKGFLGLALFAVIFGVVLKLSPERAPAVVSTSWEYFLEMMSIFPAVMILMGLFMVWVSQDLVLKYMGKSAGLKGILLSIVLGALPTGPMYAAFPLAMALRKKGARVLNIVVFLSAWACIKIPQELVELQFLGLKFMLVRLILTVIFVIGMGKIMELILEKDEVR